MKISKVATSSFGISEKSERRIVRVCSKNKIALEKIYRPLARFIVERKENVTAGGIIQKLAGTVSSQTRRNYLNVDLSNADIYYVQSMGVLKNNPQLSKSNILESLLDIPQRLTIALGHLAEHGSTPYDDMDRDVIFELGRLGLSIVYEVTPNKTLNLLLDELTYKPTIVNEIQGMHKEKARKKKYVKPAFYLPKFNEFNKYNLSHNLKQVDTIDDSYQISTIAYSPDILSGILSTFFSCRVYLEEVIYLPLLRYERVRKAIKDVVVTLPVCSKNSSKFKKNYKTELKLEPISISVGLGSEDYMPVEDSTIKFSDVGGMIEPKKEIVESIIYPFLRPDLSKKFGKALGGSILLYGPPGCGKTYLARATVGECGLSFYNINVSDIAGGQGGEAKKIHNIFESAGRSAPSVIFFDEIDAICTRRDAGDTSNMALNQFLIDIDGVERLNKNVLIIAATNRPWALDPALRRPGRFNKQIFVGPPDLDARIEILKIYARNKPLADDVDLQRIAELTNGYSAADLNEMCGAAMKIPWEEAIYGGEERDILMRDFLKIIRGYEPTLIAWILSVEKEIRESGESKIYAPLMKSLDDLKDTIEKFKERMADPNSQSKDVIWATDIEKGGT